MGVMSLSEIMDKSIELLRKYMKSIVAFVLLYGVVWLGGAFALTLISIIGVLISREAFIYVILPLLFIIGFAVLLTVNAGIIKIVGQEYFKQKVDAMGAFKTAFANFIKICGLIIVITLIALPLAVVLYALGRAFTSAFGGIIVSIEDYNWGIVLIIFLIMLTMLLAAAVIIGFISIFSFSVHSMVLEGKGVFSSIKRSYQLVRYNYWKVFGCLILFYVSTYAIQLSINSFAALIVGLLYIILRFFNFSQNFLVFFTFTINSIQTPLSLLSYAVIAPINFIMLCLLYFNLRFKKEGLDIRVRLREVQNNYERMQPSGTVVYNRPDQN